MDNSDYAICTLCSASTGRVPHHDDDYIDNDGPFCDDCYCEAMIAKDCREQEGDDDDTCDS